MIMSLIWVYTSKKTQKYKKRLLSINIHLFEDPSKGRRKNGFFTVRLTVNIYLPPPLQSAVCDFFFGVFFFILDYDSMCSETDFT